jgi:hypothetical protein
VDVLVGGRVIPGLNQLVAAVAKSKLSKKFIFPHMKTKFLMYEVCAALLWLFAAFFSFATHFPLSLCPSMCRITY